MASENALVVCQTGLMLESAIGWWILTGGGLCWPAGTFAVDRWSFIYFFDSVWTYLCGLSVAKTDADYMFQLQIFDHDCWLEVLLLLIYLFEDSLELL